jgi:hypothetical protein
MLQQIDELETGITKGELAKQVYGDATYDIAVPQPWLDSVVEQLKVDYHVFLSGVVWLYPDMPSTHSPLLGLPAPLTIDHLVWLRLAKGSE